MGFQTMDSGAKKCSISLFSGGGLGDIGIEWGAGVPVIINCELIPERAELLSLNFQNSKVFTGDIWSEKSKIIKHSKKVLAKERPWLIVLSPPCQGMSANGAGKIQSQIRAGKRSKWDERNRLILPALEIIEELKPDFFILENVNRMQNTIIVNEFDQPENILQLINRKLGKEYSIKANILDFAHYGIPHHRKRLITIGTNIQRLRTKLANPEVVFSKELSLLHPRPTYGNGREAFITLRDTIGHMPELDANSNLVDKHDKFHIIPKWNKDHYFWLQHTKEGDSAFNNNKCPSCNKITLDINITHCEKCKNLLPRPILTFQGWFCKVCKSDTRDKKNQCKNSHYRSTEKTLQITRIIRGFKTAYRRMCWDKPANTITMNSGVVSSDVKAHPSQNRVLSVREIMMLSTLNSSPKINVEWNNKFQLSPNKKVPAKMIREIIGESIPPLGMKIIVKHLLKL